MKAILSGGRLGCTLRVALMAGCLLTAGLMTAGPAFAADPSGAETVAENPDVASDYIWIIMAAALVFIMQGGFAMLTAGLCRAKNVVNLMMKNLMDLPSGLSRSSWSGLPSCSARTRVG